MVICLSEARFLTAIECRKKMHINLIHILKYFPLSVFAVFWDIGCTGKGIAYISLKCSGIYLLCFRFSTARVKCGVPLEPLYSFFIYFT